MGAQRQELSFCLFRGRRKRPQRELYMYPPVLANPSLSFPAPLYSLPCFLPQKLVCPCSSTSPRSYHPLFSLLVAPPPTLQPRFFLTAHLRAPATTCGRFPRRLMKAFGRSRTDSFSLLIREDSARVVSSPSYTSRDARRP